MHSKPGCNPDEEENSQRPPRSQSRHSKKFLELQLHAMAMAGPAAGWLEAALLKAEPSAGTVQKLLGECWAAGHPRPKEAGFGGGGKLKAELAELRGSMGIARKRQQLLEPAE